MPRQGNGGRDELRHGSASMTEPTQATLGEVTPTPSRAAVPATPNSRPPRPRAGAARRPRSSRPLRTDLRPPQSPVPARLARQLLTWRGGGSAHGGGGRAPTRRVLRRRPGDAGGGSDGRGGHSASSLRGHHLGGCGQRSGEGTAAPPLGGSVQLRGRVRPPAQERAAPCAPHVPAGPSASPSLTLLCARQDRDGFAPCPPHTHLSPVPTTACDPHGVGSALSPLNLLGLGCRRLLPATRSRPVLPHLLGRSPDPSHRAC